MMLTAGMVLCSRDTIYRKGGNDNIYAGNGANTVYGGAGNDTIYGEENTDPELPCAAPFNHCWRHAAGTFLPSLSTRYAIIQASSCFL